MVFKNASCALKTPKPFKIEQKNRLRITVQ